MNPSIILCIMNYGISKCNNIKKSLNTENNETNQDVYFYIHKQEMSFTEIL